MRKLANSELDRLTVSEFKDSQKTPLILILDDVRSLHNIGSIFRSADAFLVKKIYLCGITASPPNKEIHKTALGATDTVDWEYRENLLELLPELTQQSVRVFAIEQVDKSISLADFNPASDTTYAFVFGNEVFGVNQQAIALCEGCIEIPQLGSKHSLNVSVSAGIVIWDFFKSLHQSKTQLSHAN